MLTSVSLLFDCPCCSFLLALVDESPSVRSLAQYLLGDSLAAKAPMLAYNHFVESLFVLNDCRCLYIPITDCCCHGLHKRLHTLRLMADAPR